jgi:hypothetical protein
MKLLGPKRDSITLKGVLGLIFLMFVTYIDNFYHALSAATHMLL